MKLARTLLLALASTTALAAPAHAGLTLGFSDPRVDDNLGSLTERATAFQHARDANASVWRFWIYWHAVAPTKPPSLAAAANPGWSGYDFSAADSEIKQLVAAGLNPLPVVTSAPRWAEGKNRPSLKKAPFGSWRPSPSYYKAFAQAVAKRYSGSYAGLPRVTMLQAGNEPNLDLNISPQWVKTKGRWKATSPGIYRKLLNAFYAGVKSVAPGDKVLTAGTAPYGDLYPGQRRIPPVAFWRSLLCVKGRSHPKSTHCGSKVHFDILAHHPYPIGPPTRHARNADDAVVPDIPKITRLLKVARKAGTVLPRGPKPVWATEISWDSKPDPDGLSQKTQAHWLAGAFYVLWKSGVSGITWFNLRDQPPRPSYAASYQSGIYTEGATVAQDKRKPSFTAYRFPFTAYRKRGVAQLWGIAPNGGTVRVQVKKGSSWRTVIALRADRSRMFKGRLRVGPNTNLRAVAGSNTSLSWKTY